MTLRALVLLALLLPVAALAQTTASLTGTVTTTAGVPIPGAHVVVDDSLTGAATSEDGTYRIHHLSPGAATIVVSAVGYETERRDVILAADETASADIVLRAATTDLGELVVFARESLTGAGSRIRDLPGSAHYIGPEQLRTFADGDVMRLLREVPGVDIQEEDGYGLRPNIGLRGTGSNRTSKITVMEDGVLIAPAPYAAPAAYYFPTVGRMSGIEVRKGASQIKYGPYTTGGAINLISTPIPSELSVYAEGFIGQHRARNAHVHVGDSFRNFGFLLETYQSNVAGFKDIFPLNDLDTGFDKQDYLARLRVNTSPGARVFQSLTMKLGSMSEVSNETYLGLTEEDFRLRPLRRYAGSQMDRMQARQGQASLRHVAVFSPGFDLTTTAYRNTFYRNWYKLEGVRAPDGSRVGLGAVLSRPDEFGAELTLLRGAFEDGGSLADGRLFVRGNEREYASEGVQTIAGLGFDLGAARADLEVGLRVHRDVMDRFQAEDQYAMSEGRMNRVVAGAPGSDSNRIERGESVASFAQAEVRVGRFVFTPGLRYEHVTLSIENFGPNDPERTGAELTSVSNTVDVWIPGLAAGYAFTPAVQAFVGVHRGFAPPTAQEGVKPEMSVNHEVGLRYEVPAVAAQATAFFNDYSNLLGSDLAAGGGTGSTDQFNGGAVHVAGLELSGSADLAPLVGLTGLSLPARLAYTYTAATFQSSFQSDFGPWGTVQVGDELPYVARHQAAGSVGAEWSRYSVDARAAFVGQRRTAAGSGPVPASEELPAHLIVDLAGEVRVDARTSVFASVRNVFDEIYVASRLPAGLRPGLPRTMLLGVRTML